MDGVNGVAGGAAMDIAAGGTSSVAMSVLASTEQLVADEATRLFASLGIGHAINALA